MSENTKRWLSLEEREKLIERVIKELRIDKCVRIQDPKVTPFIANRDGVTVPTGFVVIDTWLPFKVTKVEILVPSNMFVKSVFTKYEGNLTVRVEVIETLQMCFYDAEVIEPI